MPNPETACELDVAREIIGTDDDTIAQWSRILAIQNAIEAAS